MGALPGRIVEKTRFAGGERIKGGDWGVLLFG
jgi:hypothetical protein